MEESASSKWAEDVHSPEAQKLYKEHLSVMEPVLEWIKSSGELEPTAEPTGEDVTEVIRQKARALGYGEVGFTNFDRHYVYQSRRGDLRPDMPHAICLALEQEYAPTQTIPSVEAEAAQGVVYERQGELAKELVECIRSLGYKAQVSGPTWHYGPMIPMFVEAGLGQLGANGQLLSPHFGSRARLQIILTNAKVTHDKPVDYGINNYCRLCQVCVYRCPGRALQGQRLWYRGILKNKVIFKRCRPVMARYDGCGVCMKVCPIQRYGMKPVMEHYIETAEVLGKDTENLEGYSLPDKGYFGLRKLPQFKADFFDMPRGRAEEWLLSEFKEKVKEANGNGNGSGDSEMLWVEFREKMDEVINRPSIPIDMGMDISD